MTSADQFYLAAIGFMAAIVAVMLAICGLIQLAVWAIGRRDRRRIAAIEQRLNELRQEPPEFEVVLAEFRAELEGGRLERAVEGWAK